MCGIVGYYGDNASEKVVEGLKKLEYRGYDSAGMAVAGNPSVKVVKGEGTVDNAVEDPHEGSPAIGHTRWATHGEVNDTNAHPHTDCSGSIAVVHNGIIDNFEELREELVDHEFVSDTDTEVIPHLIEEELRKTDSVREASENVVEKLEGSYAVAIVFDTGEIVAFRKGSPLAIGIDADGYHIASDTTPFLEHTDQAIFLEEDDLVVIDGEIEIYNRGERVEREVKEIEWDAEQASKSGHDHFMEKEILEQSKTVKRAVFQDRSDMEEAVKMIEEAEKVWFTGCGTSGIAASLGSKYLGRRSEFELSHELEYRSGEIGSDDLLIALSQSGETADLLELLKKVDARVLALVNVRGSTLDREAEKSLHVNAGPEIGVASTKAFTGQLALLKLLARASEGELEEGRNSILETAERIETVIEDNRKTVEELSEYLQEREDIYFIGRNRGREVAQESALKLKELSYIHAEAFAGGEFKHGTLALVEDGTPVVAFLKEDSYEEIFSNAIEAQSRGADVIGVGNGKDFRFSIDIPEDENQEILEVVPFQMLAYRTAVKRGNNPDKPRNLAKSVTVR